MSVRPDCSLCAMHAHVIEDKRELERRLRAALRRLCGDVRIDWHEWALTAIHELGALADDDGFLPVKCPCCERLRLVVDASGAIQCERCGWRPYAKGKGEK